MVKGHVSIFQRRMEQEEQAEPGVPLEEEEEAQKERRFSVRGIFYNFWKGQSFSFEPFERWQQQVLLEKFGRFYDVNRKS